MENRPPKAESETRPVKRGQIQDYRKYNLLMVLTVSVGEDNGYIRQEAESFLDNGGPC